MKALQAQIDAVAGGWQPIVERWRDSSAGRELLAFLAARHAAGATIYPMEPLRALLLTPREAVRVVILGQDPYHGPGQAEGLAFSVPEGVPLPPSLRNIRAELARDLGGPIAGGGHLGGWATQGVLLLNAVLTVEKGLPGSHAGKGWEALTDDLVRTLAEDEVPLVFMLWGAAAQARAPRGVAAGGGRHLVLRANHPSPLSARRPPVPFIGCGHFGLANAFLGPQRAIDWTQ